MKEEERQGIHRKNKDKTACEEHNLERAKTLMNKLMKTLLSSVKRLSLFDYMHMTTTTSITAADTDVYNDTNIY